jgi:hypothetical protein
MRCPLLALSRHQPLHRTCPLSGVKQTCPFALHLSAFDPKRTGELLAIALLVIRHQSITCERVGLQTNAHRIMIL